jgi:(E)-4-hydroxy-3-methylbut-2-enyl-diphosphate synthase
MGCVVNGPGESKDADVGLAAGNGKGVIFRKGKIVRTVSEAEMLDALKHEINLVIEDRKNGIFDVGEHDGYQPKKPVLKLASV